MKSNAGNGHTPQWLKTSDAAQALGVSKDFLKTQRDSSGGFLVCGKHYLPGITATSPTRWDVAEIAEALRYRGLTRVKGDALLATLSSKGAA